MIPANSGSIKINGKNIMCNLDEFRNNLGLCPQHNLFFTDLTVIEHLIFFAGVRIIFKNIKKTFLIVSPFS